MRFSKRSLEGELYIDHRASPGVSPEIAAWMGLDAGHVAKGQIVESAVVTCAHCQAVVVLRPDRTRERGWCAKCDKYLCDACTYQLHVTLECRNQERHFDELSDELERMGSSALLLQPKE